MRDYYEAYWQRPDTYQKEDPLAGQREQLLWKFCSQAGLTGGKLLDVGAGFGNLVSAANDRGWEAVGTDISATVVERAATLHPECTFTVVPVEARPWQLPMAPFNVVTSFEVIEHLLEPADLVAGAREVLRPGGYLALSTPYHGLLKNIVLSTVAFDKHFAVEGSHIRFFSDKALRKMLEREGFRLIAISHFGRFTGLWACSFVWAMRSEERTT